MRRAAAVVLAALAAWSLLPAASGHPLASAAPAQPDIVVIVTDDQRWDTVGGMPIVERELAGKGTTFANAFVVNAKCCPSRASILTGRYSHSTGVWTNRPPHGGFEVFDDDDTVAVRLEGAGYETALIGKYMNG